MHNNKKLTLNETFELAVKNHREDKTDIAQNLYIKILEIDPNHSQTQNNLGVIFQGLRENQKAKDCFEKAIKINPNYAEAYYNIGIIFKRLGEIEKVKECYEKAIELNPNYASPHYNLGNIFQEVGDLQKAKECYKKTIEINPNYVDAHYNLGNIYYNLGMYQKARECFEKAIEINPNDFKSYNNLGIIFQELGEIQKAKDCYEKAIKINPDYADAHNQLLKFLYQINNQSILFKKLETITKEGKMNAVIGSIFSRSQVKYGFKKRNPFCNDPLDYVLKTNLIEKYDFKNVIVDCVHNILKDGSLSNRAQSLIKNGYQTSGNLFSNKDFNTKEIQRIIHAEIDKYRLKFKDSKEGFINNWPTNYNLKGWLISMKSGGKLKAHMHDMGWLSGSIYVNVPPKLQTDSGNLVVCIDENENEKSINVVNGNLCLFPSSLLHYTIPFKSEEERIVLAFDIVPN
jgi:tetratricopeptide (TPR) repeat protein